MQDIPHRSRPRPLPAAVFACAVAFQACGVRAASDSIFDSGFEHFRHPGVLLDRARLDAVAAHIAAGDAPWADAFARMRTSHFVSLSYTPHPAATVTRQDSSADDLVNDGIAAYGDALIHRYTGDARYADKAVGILNAWAATLETVDDGSGHSAQLNAAWAAEVMPRAAEILRYSYRPAPGAAQLDVAGLARMFTQILLPQLSPTSAGAIYSNGNWELSMADGTLNIGVFVDDPAIFRQGLDMWRARVPAYIYATSDGPQPVYPPGGRYDTPARLACFWAGAGTVTETCTLPPGFTYLNGMAQESCRDMSHVVMGFGAMINAAETALIQRVDLYGAEQQRILDGFEFAAKEDLLALDHPIGDGSSGTVDADVCGGTFNVGGQMYKTGWEAAYSELALRRGLPMPFTAQMIQRLRPTPAALHLDWESLTSGGAP